LWQVAEEAVITEAVAEVLVVIERTMLFLLH
jgi:hypothetical protein